jgi:hypothetical protein
VGRISEKNVKDSVFMLFSGQEGTEAVTLFLIETDVIFVTPFSQVLWA